MLASEQCPMDEAVASDEGSIVDEVASAIKAAAAGQKVILIRISVGKEVTVSRVQIARELNRIFPSASLEIKDSKVPDDSIVVRDIEVE